MAGVVAGWWNGYFVNAVRPDRFLQRAKGSREALNVRDSVTSRRQGTSLCARSRKSGSLVSKSRKLWLMTQAKGSILARRNSDWRDAAS